MMIPQKKSSEMRGFLKEENVICPNQERVIFSAQPL